jgi:hypothetical protein
MSKNNCSRSNNITDKNLFGKRIILSVFLLVFLTNLNGAYAIKEYFQDSSIMKVYAPDVVNVYEPYKIKVVFNNLEMTKGYDLIGVSGSCAIALEQVTGLESPSLKLYDYRHYKYSGEKEVELLITQLTNQGTVDVWGVQEDGKNKVIFYDCTIILKKSSDITDYSSKVKVNFKPEFYAYNFGIENLPSGFYDENTNKDSKTEIVRDIWKRYLKKGDNQDIKLFMKVPGIQRVKDGVTGVHSYNELTSPSMDKFNVKITDRTYEEIQIGKETAHIFYYCENRGGSTYYAGCQFDGFILKKFGPVTFSMTAKVIENLKEYSQKEIMEAEWKNIFINAIENAYFKSDGKTSELKMESSDDDSCGECKLGYVCGACGKCIKETNSVDVSEVEISTDIKIKNDGERILNAIDSNIALTIYPNIQITNNGESIDYCNLKEPGISMTINGKVLGNDTYSGFTTGLISDDRELTSKCEIDFKEDKPKCVFILSPSSKKKFQADAKDITDEYLFTATVNNDVVKGERTFEKKAKIIMTPPKNIEINLHTRSNQIQQGSNGVLEITPNGGTTNDIIIKATLLGPGLIGLTSDKLDSDWVLKSVKRKNTMKIGYNAPALGNFDIGKELESLSMTKLQTEAAKQIALDAVTAYGGEYAGNLEALVEAGKYSSKIGKLTDTFKVINGGRNIIGTDKAIKDMTGELGDAMQVNDEKKEATWAENAADVGIVGISVAQTAVGVLTFIPNKIPGVNKLTAGLQTAFSAATNIWKANLQYISKSEKIERAKELYYPAVIVVTAQDMSGWTTQEMHVFQIAYHQVD